MAQGLRGCHRDVALHVGHWLNHFKDSNVMFVGTRTIEKSIVQFSASARFVSRVSGLYP